MREFPSTEAKDKWGIITETALQEPVTITRHGRPSLVVTSVRDYQELQRLRYESLKVKVRVGFEALDRGEYSQYHDLADLADEIKRTGRERLAETGM